MAISRFASSPLALIGYLVWHLPETKLGRSMRAVRDNELAASVSGIDVYRAKVAAFALCALLGGIGGGLFAGGFAYVSPDQFTFAESIVFLTMALLGGVAVADRRADRHRAPHRAAGDLALPEERAGPLSRDLRPRGDPHHPLHAGRHLGLRAILSAPLHDAPSLRRTAAPELVLAPAEARDAPTPSRSRGFAKHFGGLKAVDGVSFSVRRGSVHALIGPNGSGKTTTLNVLSGLYTPTAGQDRARRPRHHGLAAA